MKTFTLLLIASLFVLPLAAQEPANPAIAEKPERTFQVLKRHEVVVGDHTVTYQLVAPPQTPAPAAPAPAARELSPQELEAQRRREAKQQKVLFFSATVLDHKLTELRWFDDRGMYRAFSNIDFQYFNGMGEIETADTIYTLLPAFDTGTAEALTERTRAFPQVAQLPTSRSAWLLAEAPGQENTPEMTAWDSIHTYYDAHRAELIQAHAQREAASAERERQLRENPPARKNRIISFWKKDSAQPQPGNGSQP